LEGWVTGLLEGDLTGRHVAYGLVLSTEFLSNALNDEEYLQILYEAFFNRQPDPNGMQGWLDALEDRASWGSVLNGFIYAREFAELCDEYGIFPF
jgi:hypothetical protein